MIGENIRDMIVYTVKGLVDDYITEIDGAYTLTPDALDLTFKVRLSPGKRGGEVDIKSDLTFVKGVKIKDTVNITANEVEQDLFERPAEEGVA